MPVVQIKDSNQKVRFPDDMEQDQMLAALRGQYPTPVSQKIDDALSKPESTISNRDVSLAEKTKQKIANFLFDNQIVSDRYGAQRIGDNLSSLLGVLPGIGDAQAGDEFGRAVAEGDGLGIGMGALAALPIVGDVASKGVKKLVNRYGDESFRMPILKGKDNVGEIEYLDDGKSITIIRADVDDSEAGKGLGTDAYKKLIDKSLGEGKIVKSDAIVSPSAQRVYDKLAEQGYTVEKAENLGGMRSGATTTTAADRIKQRGEAATIYKDGVGMSAPFRIKGDPVFTVTGKNQPQPLTDAVI